MLYHLTPVLSAAGHGELGVLRSTPLAPSLKPEERYKSFFMRMIEMATRDDTEAPQTEGGAVTTHPSVPQESRGVHTIGTCSTCRTKSSVWKRLGPMWIGVLAVLWAGCSDEPAQLTLGPPCEYTAVPRPTGEVVVRGEEAPCVVEFREVVRLQGSVDGVAPRRPIAVGPGGTYVTWTYTYGQLAVWSPDGKLVRVIGNGTGSGPGEFRRALDLAVDSAGVVSIVTGGGPFDGATRSPAPPESTIAPLLEAVARAWRPNQPRP